MDYSLERRTSLTPTQKTPTRHTPTQRAQPQQIPTQKTPTHTPAQKTQVRNATTPARDSPQKRGASDNKNKGRTPETSRGATENSAKVPNQTKIYTDEQIRELTSDGYITVFPALWDHIPKGAHIRFLKADKKDGTPRGARFKPGGFVKNHYTTVDGKKMMIVENKIGGRVGELGYITFPLAYDDLETIWKKYDRDSFIEIHLIYNSLAQKKQQIEELNMKVTRLENILRNAIK